jgi:hypothetical protein
VERYQTIECTRQPTHPIPLPQTVFLIWALEIIIFTHF